MKVFALSDLKVQHRSRTISEPTSTEDMAGIQVEEFHGTKVDVIDADMFLKQIKLYWLPKKNMVNGDEAE